MISKKYTMKNLEFHIRNFIEKSEATHRYSSFDYCYNYFKTTVDLNKDIEKSCYVLGFYLASWGMFRGSSFILQKNAKHFQKLIEYYSDLDKDYWLIDVDNYSEKNISKIIKIYDKTKEIIVPKENKHVVLVTKVLLGVFGFIPAYDQYFCKTFKKIFKGKCAFTSVNEKSLNCIKEFYNKNITIIDNFANKTFTKEFLTGVATKITYPKAKIIDMYGFTYSNKDSS